MREYLVIEGVVKSHPNKNGEYPYITRKKRAKCPYCMTTILKAIYYLERSQKIKIGYFCSDCQRVFIKASYNTFSVKIKGG